MIYQEWRDCKFKMEKSITNKRAKIFYLFWSIKNKGTANWKAARALSLSSNRLYINKPVIKVFISSIHQEWRDYKFKMEKNELQRIPIPESFWNLKISLSPKPNKIYFIHFHSPRMKSNNKSLLQLQNKE